MKLITVICLICALNLSAVTYLDAKTGEKEYKKGNFDISEKKFESAAASNPDKDPVLFYNHGNSLFQQQKYDER
jgi:hypothetical protein